jgi:hypothetical protein
MFFFELLQYFVGTVDEIGWHTCHLRHVKYKAVCASAWCQFAKENYFVTNFFIGDMIIFYAW